MLYRIDMTTTQRMTIEAASEAEAQTKADEMVKEINSHHHHGEETTALVTHVVTHVPYSKGA